VLKDFSNSLNICQIGQNFLMDDCHFEQHHKIENKKEKGLVLLFIYSFSSLIFCCSSSGDHP